MTALARTVALAAALAAVALARPGPAPQELSEASDGMDPLEVQGLLEEFQAISEREGDKRRRRSLDEAEAEAAVEPQNEDEASGVAQGLIDEFQAISERERERRRRAAPAEQPQEAEELGPVQSLLEEFAGVRARRDVEPAAVPVAGLMGLLDQAMGEEQQQEENKKK